MQTNLEDPLGIETADRTRVTASQTDPLGIEGGKDDPLGIETQAEPPPYSGPPRNSDELAAQNWLGEQSVAPQIAALPPGLPTLDGKGGRVSYHGSPAVDFLTETVSKPLVQLWKPDEDHVAGVVAGLANGRLSGETLQKVTSAAQGVETGLAGTVNFFTSPLGIATLGTGSLPAAAQKTIAAAFTMQMASQVPEIAGQLEDELAKPAEQRDVRKIAQLVTDGITTTGFAAAGAYHGLKGITEGGEAAPQATETPEATPTPQAPPESSPQPAQQAPGSRIDAVIARITGREPASETAPAEPAAKAPEVSPALQVEQHIDAAVQSGVITPAHGEAAKAIAATKVTTQPDVTQSAQKPAEAAPAIDPAELQRAMTQNQIPTTQDALGQGMAEIEAARLKNKGDVTAAEAASQARQRGDTLPQTIGVPEGDTKADVQAQIEAELGRKVDAATIEEGLRQEAQDHPKLPKEVLPQIVADELAADPKAYEADLQAELAKEMGYTEAEPAAKAQPKRRAQDSARLDAAQAQLDRLEKSGRGQSDQAARLRKTIGGLETAQRPDPLGIEKPAAPNDVPPGQSAPTSGPSNPTVAQPESAASIPKLRPGEKGTADLLQGPEAPFNLAGERASDGDRIAAERAAAKVVGRDPIEAKLSEWIEKTNLKPGALYEGVTSAPVWITKAAANGALRIMRASYKAGMKLADCISEGLTWLKNQNLKDFDEKEAREWLTKASTDGSMAERKTSEYLPNEAEAPASGPAPEDRMPKPGREELDRRRAELEKTDTLSATLPERMKTAWGYAQRGYAKMKAMHAAGANRELVAIQKGAADNTAVIFGKETSNIILHDLNRAFGATSLKEINKANPIAENALTFVLESGEGAAKGQMMLGDPKSRLREARDKLLASDHRGTLATRQALRAIAFAEQHWDKLAPIAKDYASLTDAQNAFENEHGHATLYRQGGYVFHLQDVNEHSMLPEASGGGVGVSAPFKHIRDYPTYADSIAAGVTPKSLSAVDLLQRRMTLGRKLVNYGTWFEGLKGIEDPTSKTPLAADVIVRKKADGSRDVTAPTGYTVHYYAGKGLAIHNGYAGLFSALTDPSWMSKSAAGESAMKVAGTTKHLQLLFDSYHLGRLAFWNALSRTGSPTYRKGVTLLDNTREELQTMIDRGEVPKEWGKDLMQAKLHIDGMLASGMNVGGVADNLHTDWIQKTPGIGTFNKWLYNQYQRGAMVEVALNEFGRQQAMHPDIGSEPLYRKTAKAVNTRFGNLGTESWIRSKTGQDLARVAFLAPQWNESLIRSELGAIREAIGGPRVTDPSTWKPWLKGETEPSGGLLDIARHPKWAATQLAHGRMPMDMLAKAVGTAILGQFVANQIINYGTRGKPTWENEEEQSGAKISAYIPDWIGGGPGMFYNPVALPMEIAHLITKNAERSGGDYTRAMRDFITSRLNVFGRAAHTLYTREDSFGRQLRSGTEVAAAAAGQLIPAPISGSAVYRGAKQVATGEHEEAYPGQFQKQIMQSAGIKTGNAPGPEQRIRNLAVEFNREKGVKEETGWHISDYEALNQALRMDNMRDAALAMEDLLKEKNPKQVAQYYRTWVKGPFTRNKAREAQFYSGLNPEQRAVYQKAKQARISTAQKAYGILREALKSQPAAGSADPDATE